MAELAVRAHESIFILDGGPDAELPQGTSGPVLAGPEAVFIGGRVAADAPTLVRLGVLGGERDLLLTYSGELATPHRVLRLLTVMGDVLAELPVPTATTSLDIYLSDPDEPDEVFVAVRPT